MARLPTVSGDANAWGTLLNEFLSIAHRSDGSNAALFNVKDYGAKGDNSTDDIAAINSARAAITAAGSGKLFFPPGYYRTSATISLDIDSMGIKGSGWSSVIRPVSGAQFDVISTPIPPSQGTAGYQRDYVSVEDIRINCGDMTGTTQGRGNGIHLYGTRWSRIHNVYVHQCKNWAFLLEGDSTNGSYNNHLSHLHTDLGAGNLYCASEATTLFDSVFKWFNNACAAQQPAFGSSTNAYHVELSSGRLLIMGNVFGGGGDHTHEALRCENNSMSRIAYNSFDMPRYQAIQVVADQQMIDHNQFIYASTVGSVPCIVLGSNYNQVTDNYVDKAGGSAAMHYTYFVSESGGPFTGNIIKNNRLWTGTSGFISQHASSTNFIRDNPGYNPVGQVTAPGFPASTTGLINYTGLDVNAYIANGAADITQIQIAGLGGTYVTTGLTIAANAKGQLRIPAGCGVKFTYASGTPTWTWFEG